MSKEFIFAKDINGVDRRIGAKSVGGGQYGLILANEENDKVRPTALEPGVAGWTKLTATRGLLTCLQADADASFKATFSPPKAGTYKLVMEIAARTQNATGCHFALIMDAVKTGENPNAALPVAVDFDPAVTTKDIQVQLKSANLSVDDGDVVNAILSKDTDDGTGSFDVHDLYLERQ